MLHTKRLLCDVRRTIEMSRGGQRRASAATIRPVPTGAPLSITRENDRVILRHKWMDVKRIVYLNQREHPKGGVRTSLGHSIGPFEGDTLVIETVPLGRRSQPVCFNRPTSKSSLSIAHPKA